MINSFIYASAFIALSVSWAKATDIYEAIDSGYVEQVAQILEQDTTLLNAKNPDGMTPLNHASYLGKGKIVKKLLALGADADIGDNENSQPIQIAAAGGHNDVIGILLEHGVDINARDDNGMTALLFSISFQKYETASYLLDSGASTQISNNSGLTPLHYTALRGQVELIDRLIALGADIDARTIDGETPLHYTVWRNQLEAAERLLKAGARHDLKENYGRTPLHHAARETGNREMAELLIRYGAEVNSSDRFNDTPLILAAWRGFSGIVNLLLDNNADVPVTGDNSKELLSHAVEKGIDRLFEIMVSGGADLSIKNRVGSGMLHTAAAGGSTAIINVFISRGFSINEIDLFGWTPLHHAAYKGRFDAVELLISKGADINTRTKCGKSPYNLADEKNRAEVKQLLIERGAKTGPQKFPDLTDPYLGQTPPGDTPQLFALDIVTSNRGQHSAVAFSPEGNQAFWSTYFMPNDSGYATGALMSSKLVNGKWTPPYFPEFTVAMETHDDVPFFSPDGGKLYFISRRPFQPGQRGGKENIWFVEKTESGWSDPLPVPGALNNMQMHWQFSVTNTGTIYFPGEDPSGYGMGDIYRSEYIDGEYVAPENLGPVINTAGGETCPFIAPDESYLLFTGLRPRESDIDEIVDMIYLSFKTGDNQWSEPINTGLEGLCPLISPDGKYLFYNGRYKEQHGIFWVKADFLWKLKSRDPD
ncbi:MAG: ankyrin repeat domain-containing protein [Candidatus Zixiibacteriota bacterium]|nr:MAG: ankyrin repeat domain-containing protein [candidate division Zixibacteria bacterium]